MEASLAEKAASSALAQKNVQVPRDIADQPSQIFGGSTGTVAQASKLRKPSRNLRRAPWKRTVRVVYVEALFRFPVSFPECRKMDADVAETLAHEPWRLSPPQNHLMTTLTLLDPTRPYALPSNDPHPRPTLQTTLKLKAPQPRLFATASSGSDLEPDELQQVPPWRAVSGGTGSNALSECTLSRYSGKSRMRKPFT